MKRFFILSRILFIFFIAGFFFMFLWLSYGKETKQLSYISPVPDFLTLAKNNQVKGLDFWLPFIQQTHASGTLENLTAKSVLMYDLTTNKTIYEKNADQRMAMASLTKIMTAIVSLENKRTDDIYTVYSRDIVGEDSMGVSPGEKLSLEELMYGLLLPSGNDAAEVLADNYPDGGRPAFITAMNQKAQALGLVDTHYDNPSGLQGDGTQYTTAYDLLVITRYALQNFPEFAQTVSTASYTIPQTATHKEYDLANETNLLTTYPGVRGVKTGYTPEAGLCLVTYLDYSGHKIIGIVLNSENRRGEMKDLLDYSLESVGITPPPYNG
jgi:D-alanyl-D-alanine carboxypeptidase (penicillin-binding protein 5/6)